MKMLFGMIKIMKVFSSSPAGMRSIVGVDESYT